MCDQCPNESGFETYKMLYCVWDVKKARELVKGREIVHHITPETLRKYGLQIDKSEPDKEGYFTISMFGHSEEHLAHIPEEKLQEPLIFAPYISKSKKSGEIFKQNVLIDGTHRAIILARRGVNAPVVVLSEQESLDCLAMSEADRKYWNLFPGMKKGKIA